MMKNIFLFLILVGCVPAQKPNQTIINYTDNSIQLCGDNNQVSSEPVAQQTAEPTQTTEEVTKDEMWKFWVIVLIAIGCIVLYKKYKKGFFGL